MIDPEIDAVFEKLSKEIHELVADRDAYKKEALELRKANAELEAELAKMTQLYRQLEDKHERTMA